MYVGREREVIGRDGGREEKDGRKDFHACSGHAPLICACMRQ